MTNKKPATISESEYNRIKGQLKDFRQLPIVIVSDSMTPLMPIGCKAMVVPCEFKELRRFDILVYFSEGILICHCFLQKSSFPVGGEETVLLRGIKGAGWDLPVRKSQIFGRVVSHRLSFWQKFLLIVRS